MDINEILNNNLKLGNLMKNLPIRIIERMISKTYKANSILFYKGDPIRYIYALYEGEVQISNTFKDGYIYEINRTRMINFIGEQTILSEHNIASVTVTTMTPCKFILIRPADFLEWIKYDNEFALFLLRDMSRRGYENSISLGANGYLSKKQLLEKYLCTQYENQNESKVTIQTKRQTMSECIGVSLRSLERGISSLKNEKLITIEKRKITVNQLQYAAMSKNLES